VQYVEKINNSLIKEKHESIREREEHNEGTNFQKGWVKGGKRHLLPTQNLSFGPKTFLSGVK
jgi:hypothetical protein